MRPPRTQRRRHAPGNDSRGPDAIELKPPTRVPFPQPRCSLFSLHPGHILDGKYLLKRKLGAGSTGSVFEAEHVVMGKRVAIKTLNPTSARDPQAQSAFVTEARAAARIGHLHVVDIYDLGVIPDGTPYLVMELLQGETLQQILRSRGALGSGYAAELMLQLLSGLAAAHSQGIVHRDLKPANVMVTHPRPDRPHVKVLDFGIAKGIPKPVADQPNVVLGTPMYMPPEQAMGYDVDERADLYSAGAILFEMLAGCTPFEGHSAHLVMQRVARGETRPLRSLARTVEPALLELVEEAMALDRSLRPQTAGEFSGRLHAFVSPGRVPSLVPEPARSLAPIPLVNALRRPNSLGDALYRDPAAALGVEREPKVFFK